MNFKLCKPKNPFKTEPLSAEFAYSLQILNKKLTKNEQIESFKQSAYSKIDNLCKSINGNTVHFVSLPYPTNFSKDEIECINKEFEENGFKVTSSYELGYYTISWNHKYLSNG